MLASWSGHLSPSPSSDSSSTRSSHLSLLTSSSSITAASSPLPSPSPSVHSIGSKTHAFFGSPFDGSPIAAPPPNLNKRSIRPQTSIDSIASEVSSMSASSGHESSAGADETPRIEQRAPKRSLNADFFGSSLLPTPPPTASYFPISPAESRDSSSSPPLRRQPLPPIPLSRLFPSRRRYGTEDDTSGESPASHRRQLLHLDHNVPPHSAPPHGYPGSPRYTEAYSASPVAENGSMASAHHGPADLPTPLPSDNEHERPSYVSPTPKSKAPPPQPEPQATPLEPGALLRSSSLSLQLERVLGQGAFSSVWLARDVEGQLGALEMSRKTSLLRSQSQKRGRRRRLEGTRPKFPSVARKSAGAVPVLRENRTHGQEVSDESIYLSEQGSLPPRLVSREPGRLVAVKMTERELCEKNSRSRVSFVREVEILRHISHPSIVSYVHSFSTTSHHSLVLEYVGGGELFDMIDNAESHSRLTQPLLRRMFGELCKAVGWMHGVGLVHRDIKLENILLTASPFGGTLPALPAPLIKLSDFGLSRFIDPAQPLLTTLCGSESYAAPELVTGRPYDGRETDAWACGVVLYALTTRSLPFDRQRMRESDDVAAAQSPARHRADLRAERRALLMRIAKAEYSWPEEGDGAEGATISFGEGETLTSTALAHSAGVRQVVERLLVRDPKKRSKIIDLWEEEWMRGEGAPIAPVLSVADGDASPTDSRAALPEQAAVADEQESQPQADLDVDADDDEGLIVDGEDIGPGSVAHQEH